MRATRAAKLGWGLFLGSFGLGWMNVMGTVFLDARGGHGSALEQTLETILFCSPGIVFASVGVILVMRAIRNR